MEPVKLTDSVNRATTAHDFVIRQYDIEGIEYVRGINLELFNEERIINHYQHPDLLVYTATLNEMIIGFKVGYGKARGLYYSAKGGVLPIYRRKGIATQLMDCMMLEALKRGYHTFGFDTFPNQHKGMLILGLKEGFKITNGGWNKMHRDYHLHLELNLVERFK